MGLLACSSYISCVSLETTMHCYAGVPQEQFLADALSAGQRLTAMLEKAREGHEP